MKYFEAKMPNLVNIDPGTINPDVLSHENHLVWPKTTDVSEHAIKAELVRRVLAEYKSGVWMNVLIMYNH